MTVTAIIPARGGSKGLPGKNLVVVGGRPLVARAVEACRAAGAVDRVIVTTDDDEIAACASDAGAETVRRPDALSGDRASSESALLHALSTSDADRQSDIVVFVQCTSPFIDPGDVDSAITRVRRGEDVVFSATESHAFLWTDSSRGVSGVNHDAATRERRQDRARELVETGAFYVMRREGFETAGHRFFGRIGAVEVDPLHRFEIDGPSDAILCRAIAALADPLGARPLVDRPVDALVTDFDGVHTDDRAILSESGTESVSVNRSDGMGISKLLEAGFRVLILSKERNPVVSARASKLGVECMSGIDDKASALGRWATERRIGLERIAYVGNDVNDLECLEMVGSPIVVANAHPDVLHLDRVVRTRRVGGDGAVREVADALLANSRAQSSRARRVGTASVSPSDRSSPPNLTPQLRGVPA